MGGPRWLASATSFWYLCVLPARLPVRSMPLWTASLFDKWSLNKTSQTSNAHAEQNGTDGFTLLGNTSGIGRRSNDRFFANVQSIGNISGRLTVTKTAP